MPKWRDATFCKTGNGVQVINLKGEVKPAGCGRQFSLGEHTEVLLNGNNRKALFAANNPRHYKAKALIRRRGENGLEYYLIPFCCVRTL